jgi:hypothetical protein
MIRIPNPIASPCQSCGEPTVIAEFATGSHRVHCGTYRASCTSSRIRTIGRTRHGRVHRVSRSRDLLAS